MDKEAFCQRGEGKCILKGVDRIPKSNPNLHEEGIWISSPTREIWAARLDNSVVLKEHVVSGLYHKMIIPVCVPHCVRNGWSSTIRRYIDVGIWGSLVFNQLSGLSTSVGLWINLGGD